MTNYWEWCLWLQRWNIKYEEKEYGNNFKCVIFNGCVKVIFEKATEKFITILWE